MKPRYTKRTEGGYWVSILHDGLWPKIGHITQLDANGNRSLDWFVCDLDGNSLGVRYTRTEAAELLIAKQESGKACSN